MPRWPSKTPPIVSVFFFPSTSMLLSRRATQLLLLRYFVSSSSILLALSNLPWTSKHLPLFPPLVDIRASSFSRGLSSNTRHSPLLIIQAAARPIAPSSEPQPSLFCSIFHSIEVSRQLASPNSSTTSMILSILSTISCSRSLIVRPSTSILSFTSLELSGSAVALPRYLYCRLLFPQPN